MKSLRVLLYSFLFASCFCLSGNLYAANPAPVAPEPAPADPVEAPDFMALAANVIRGTAAPDVAQPPSPVVESYDMKNEDVNVLDDDAVKRATEKREMRARMAVSRTEMEACRPQMAEIKANMQESKRKAEEQNRRAEKKEGIRRKSLTKFMNTIVGGKTFPLVTTREERARLFDVYPLYIDNGDEGVKAHIGLLNRDIANLGFMGANLVSDYVLFRHLGRMRVKHLCESVEHEYPMLIALLEEVEEIQEETKLLAEDEVAELEALASKSIWGRFKKFCGFSEKKRRTKKERSVVEQKKEKSKKELLEENKERSERVRTLTLKRVAVNKRLERFLKSRQRIVTYNPLKLRILFPVLLRFLAQKGLSHLQERYVPDNPSDDENDFDYVNDKDKGLVPYEGPILVSPLSPLRPIKRYVDGQVRSACGKIGELVGVPIKVPKLQHLGEKIAYPKFWRGKFVKELLNFACVYMAAFLFDSIYSNVWENFILNDHKQCIKMLKKFGEAKESGNRDKIENSRNNLHKLIIRGQGIDKSPLKLIWEWRSMMGMGAFKVMALYATVAHAHRWLEFGSFAWDVWREYKKVDVEGKN
jgi:hypothetical protein